MKFTINWEDDQSRMLDADPTWGGLSIEVDGEFVWGKHKPIQWTWSDLLNWLTENWGFLTKEQRWPYPRPDDTGHLYEIQQDLINEEYEKDSYQHQTVFGLSWINSVNRRVTDLKQSWFEFRERHDLSTSTPGKYPPPLWFVRQGQYVDVLTAHKRYEVPLEEALNFLTDLGETIAKRLGIILDCADLQLDWQRIKDGDNRD